MAKTRGKSFILYKIFWTDSGPVPWDGFQEVRFTDQPDLNLNRSENHVHLIFATYTANLLGGEELHKEANASLEGRRREYVEVMFKANGSHLFCLKQSFPCQDKGKMPAKHAKKTQKFLWGSIFIDIIQ